AAQEGQRRWTYNRSYLILSGAVVFLSLAPFLLIVMGAGFSAPGVDSLTEMIPAIDREPRVLDVVWMLSGSNAYTILEWSVVVIALVTALWAFAHFHVKRAMITPIICMAAFWSGFVTAFNVLAANGLGFEVASFRNFIPFTQALGQAFTALVLIVAASLVLIRRSGAEQEGFRATTVVGVSAIFGLLAYVLIYWTATAEVLPQTIFAEAVIKRPWDMPALLFFIIALTVIFPLLHFKERSHFSFALWLSAVPFIAAQVYAGFGSAMLFDEYFNASLLMKVMAFAVIFAGLVWDYSRASQEEALLNRQLSIRDRRIRMLVENAFEAIVIFDEDRNILSWNPQAEEIFGWSAREVMGKDVAEVVFSRERASAFRRSIERFVNGEEEEGLQRPREALACRRGDTEFPAEISMIWARDEEGEYLFAALIRDLTEQRNLQARMIQVDRLVAVGTLAAGVAHEINNPLSYVISNVDYGVETLDEVLPILWKLSRQTADGADLKDVYELLTDVHNALQAAEQGTERVRGIIEDMRVFARTSGEESHAVSVERALQVALRMTRNEVENRARLVVEGQDMPLVLGDEPRLTQVFVNLLINAAHAIPYDEESANEIRVRTRRSGERAIIE
ncbi:MAG: two-component system sensor histidine kinase NtrB, partial [Bradymonadaceae bacterium]